MKSKLKNYRHGDVIIMESDSVINKPSSGATPRKGSDRLVLAYGEVTGHSHRFVAGDVQVFDDFSGGTNGAYVKVKSAQAIRIQRRYDPRNNRATVLD